MCLLLSSSELTFALVWCFTIGLLDGVASRKSKHIPYRFFKNSWHLIMHCVAPLSYDIVAHSDLNEKTCVCKVLPVKRTFCDFVFCDHFFYISFLLNKLSCYFSFDVSDLSNFSIRLLPDHFYIHPFSKLLVVCRVAGMLEPIPVSRCIGRETPWTKSL